MKVKHCIILILTVSLAGMALTYWYMNNRGSTVTAGVAKDTKHDVPLLITTAQPTMRLFTLRVPWVGTVEPQAVVELTALVAGRVEVIAAKDQAGIEEGRLVVRLGGAQVEGLRAKRAAEVASLNSQLDRARQTVARRQQSLESQLATKDQVTTVQDAYITLQTQLRETRLDLETLEKQICITAPMSGIFTNRRISVGQDVKVGQVIGEIVDVGHLRIVASIFSPQGSALQGKEALIRLQQNQTLTGLVRSVLPQAGKTGAVIVWIEGAQIDAQLRPGQTVGGSMVIVDRPQALAVPESAIIYDSEERPYIFVQHGGTYERLSVKPGLMQDGWVEVVSGLKENQSVVTQGAYELFYRQFNEQFKVMD